MAKGDKKKVEKQIASERQLAKQREQQVTQAATPIQETASQAYQQAVPQAQENYADIMGQFKRYGEDIRNRMPAPGAQGAFKEVTGSTSPFLASYSRSPEFGQALAGYGEFAQTGGYSPQAIQELRARGVSPIRSVYANAQANLDRQRALAGGYSPNYAAATARMTRDLPQALADQVSKVNAGLAEQQAQGRLAGLAGLGGLSGQEAGLQQQVNLANQAAQQRANDMNVHIQALNNQGRFDEAQQLQNQQSQLLGAIQGQAGLYGTTPGMAGQFGQQALASTGQLADIAGQFGQQGMGLNQQQIQAAQLPSNFETGLGRVGQVAGMAAPFVAPFLGPAVAAGGAMNRQVFDPRNMSMYQGF